MVALTAAERNILKDIVASARGLDAGSFWHFVYWEKPQALLGERKQINKMSSSVFFYFFQLKSNFELGLQALLGRKIDWMQPETRYVLGGQGGLGSLDASKWQQIGA